MGDLNGSVSLAERLLAMFVIGRRDGQRITVRVSILWDMHQFTTRPYYIDKMETLLSPRIHNIRGLIFLLFDIRIILRTSRHLRTDTIKKSLRSSAQFSDLEIRLNGL